MRANDIVIDCARGVWGSISQTSIIYINRARDTTHVAPTQPRAGRAGVTQKRRGITGRPTPLFHDHVPSADRGKGQRQRLPASSKAITIIQSCKTRTSSIKAGQLDHVTATQLPCPATPHSEKPKPRCAQEATVSSQGSPSAMSTVHAHSKALGGIGSFPRGASLLVPYWQ